MRMLLIMCCLAFAGLNAIAIAAEPVQDFTVESPTHGTKFVLSEAKGKLLPCIFCSRPNVPIVSAIRRVISKSLKLAVMWSMSF